MPKALGVFPGGATDHDVESPPGNGLSYSFYLSSIGPARGGSGLDATSARVEFTGIVWQPRTAQPPGGPGGIDQAVLTATTALLDAYSGDLTLGDTVRCIDLLGAYGTPLSAAAGYINVSGTRYRVMQVCVPVVLNDCWSQDD